MICENCGKEHNGSYGSGRFCCISCAKSFSTKNINKYKSAKCINCGKEITIRKNASSLQCLCDECKQLKNNKKQCKICGRTINTEIGCNNEFCKHHNIQHFKSLIKYFGFDKTKLGTLEVEQEFNRVRNILYDLYWNKNLSSSDLAKLYQYNSTPTNITQKFFKNYLNIPIKDIKYSVIENYLENRQPIIEINNQYKQQWHVTWNEKEVYLRSSYELDYAKKLDKQQIDYDVECLRIKYWDSQKQEYRCAIPDFYIPSLHMIVEIKSSYTLDEQNMKDKMKTYKELGYNTKLICDHKEIEI